jgi:hypothetical protein
MAIKNFNPLKDAHSALQFLLMLTPVESKQQAIRAASIVKAALDEQKSGQSQTATLNGQNEILRQQIIALQAELTALQFVPETETLVEEKKRGRKVNG